MNKDSNKSNNNKNKIVLIFEKANDKAPYFVYCYLNDKFENAIQEYRQSSKDNSPVNFYFNGKKIDNYDETIDELKIKDNSYITVKA